MGKWAFLTDDSPPPSLILNQRVRAEMQRPPPAAPAADIQVVFPNGGETLSEGMEYQIEWRAPDWFGRPRVIFMKAGRAVKTIEPGEVFPVKTGDPWKLSWIVGSELVPGNDYHLRLEKADRSQGDSSNALFSVSTGEPYLAYVGPRERTLTMGRHTLIRWRAGHLTRPILIYVFDDQNHGVLIASNLPPDRRSFEWRIGELATLVTNYFRAGSVYHFHIVSELGCSARSPDFSVNIPD